MRLSFSSRDVSVMLSPQSGNFVGLASPPCAPVGDACVLVLPGAVAVDGHERQAGLPVLPPGQRSPVEVEPLPGGWHGAVDAGETARRRGHDLGGSVDVLA